MAHDCWSPSLITLLVQTSFLQLLSTLGVSAVIVPGTIIFFEIRPISLRSFSSLVKYNVEVSILGIYISYVDFSKY